VNDEFVLIRASASISIIHGVTQQLVDDHIGVRRRSDSFVKGTFVVFGWCTMTRTRDSSRSVVEHSIVFRPLPLPDDCVCALSPLSSREPVRPEVYFSFSFNVKSCRTAVVVRRRMTNRAADRLPYRHGSIIVFNGTARWAVLRRRAFGDNSPVNAPIAT